MNKQISDSVKQDKTPHNREWDKDGYINKPVSKNGINHAVKNKILMRCFILVL